MASKDEGAGCLIIVVLIGGYFLIKKIIWPWASGNAGMVWTILATIVLVVVVWFVGGRVVRSQSKRRLFDGLHGSWLRGADAKLDAAEKFAADDEARTKNIDKRISDLEKAVRGSH